MSQPSNYRYQSYDQTGNLKGGMPPAVNGQSSVMQHTQNGIPPPSYNSAGTPSSQSSRDPSRETSRDPSPTQYLHNQYRPQLSRPPMPPINGQQTISHSPLSPQPPRPMHSSQSSPLASPQNPCNPNVSASSDVTSNAYQTNREVSSSSAQSLSTGITSTRYNIANSNVTPLTAPVSQNVGTDQIRPGQSMVGQNLPPPSSVPSTLQSHSVSSQSIWNKDNSCVQNIASQSLSATSTGQTWGNPSVNPNSNDSQTISHSYSGIQPSTSVPSTMWNTQSSVSYVPNTTSQTITNRPINSNQTLQNSDANSNSYQGISQPIGVSQQNVNSSRNQEPPSTDPSTATIASQASTSSLSQSSMNMPNTMTPSVNLRGPQPINQLPTIPSVNTSMQSVFGSQTNQQSTAGNQASMQKQSAPPVSHSSLSKPQAQYPNPQQAPPGSQPNFSSSMSTGATQSNQMAYGSQQSLASQRKYPQQGYSAQQPIGPAVGSSHLGTSKIPGIPTSSPGQVPLRPPPTSAVGPSHLGTSQLSGIPTSSPGQIPLRPPPASAAGPPHPGTSQLSGIPTSSAGQAPFRPPMASALGPPHLGTSQFSGIPTSSSGQVPLRPPPASAAGPPHPGISQLSGIPTSSPGQVPLRPPMASAVGPPHVGTSQHSGIAPLSSGQVPIRPPLPITTAAPPPPLPGQQQQQQQQDGHYDYRTPYFGQMSNVPLDNMTKRYPTANNPEQMNQLNTQMGNLNVTRSGFNELWGQQSVDLLQCRNILPGEKVEPPKIKLHEEFLDSVNCSPEIFRCTVTKIPESNALLQKCRLPLGVLIHPFKDLNNLPVIQCVTIVRCRACRTYINPFVYFVDSKRWKCNLCHRVNELPEEFQFDPVTKSYGDPSRRPEVKTSTIEFIAPSEYMLRPPQPAVYLFVLDVSRLAVDSGYLTVVCETIAEELTNLPGDGRTQVGFVAVDSAVHFFSMPENVSQPHELIMLDVEDVFLPCPDNLIVNLKEREELIRDLLEQLPTKFHGTHDTNSALGAGLQAALKLMSPTGGRVTVFQTCLPNIGPGALQPREDPNTRASKDVPHLNPATDFYKRLALDCSAQQIAVDLFLLNSQYSDLATLSGMCKFSGGCIHHMPLFRSNKPQHNETLERMLRRYLTRKIGFEAVMRIRCTRGLSIHTFHGNFFVRSTDLLSLPNVNPDAGFGMQVSIEENLSDVQSVCFQAALLYTSSKGERRIRVHTMCLPVSSSMTDILYSADQQAIIGLLSKMAVDRSQQSSLSDARDALINVAIDVLSSYKLAQSSSAGGLMAPVNMKLLPLYIIAMMKSMAFRSGTSTRLDDRVYAMCQMKTLPLGLLMQMIYPDMYPVHALDDRYSRDIDGRSCPQSVRLHLSAEKLDFRGVFLMDAGDRIFIYVGKSVDPMFCCNVLGVQSYASIPEELYDLPELDTVESERLRNFVFSLQEEKPFYAPLQIIRDDSHFKSLFTDRLIEDRVENALSYYEFLQHLKTQVK